MILFSFSLFFCFLYLFITFFLSFFQFSVFSFQFSVFISVGETTPSVYSFNCSLTQIRMSIHMSPASSFNIYSGGIDALHSYEPRIRHIGTNNFPGVISVNFSLIKWLDYSLLKKLTACPLKMILFRDSSARLPLFLLCPLL